LRFVVHVGVDGIGAQVEPLGRLAHLVAHQGAQGREDQRQPAHGGNHLVHEALAPACGLNQQHALALQRGANRLLLSLAKLSEAEARLQSRFQIHSASLVIGRGKMIKDTQAL
jgi:hypothetical protein